MTIFFHRQKNLVAAHSFETGVTTLLSTFTCPEITFIFTWKTLHFGGAAGLGLVIQPVASPSSWSC